VAACIGRRQDFREGMTGESVGGALRSQSPCTLSFCFCYSCRLPPLRSFRPTTGRLESQAIAGAVVAAVVQGHRPNISKNISNT
jgi:hypothetical protein